MSPGVLYWLGGFLVVAFLLWVLAGPHVPPMPMPPPRDPAVRLWCGCVGPLRGATTGHAELVIHSPSGQLFIRRTCIVRAVYQDEPMTRLGVPAEPEGGAA